MKITNDVLNELKKIRSAIDNAYDKLNVVMYDRVTAVKTNYAPINPSEDEMLLAELLNISSHRLKPKDQSFLSSESKISSTVNVGSPRAASNWLS